MYVYLYSLHNKHTTHMSQLYHILSLSLHFSIHTQLTELQLDCNLPALSIYIYIYIYIYPIVLDICYSQHTPHTFTLTSL